MTGSTCGITVMTGGGGEGAPVLPVDMRSPSVTCPWAWCVPQGNLRDCCTPGCPAPLCLAPLLGLKNLQVCCISALKGSTSSFHPLHLTVPSLT